MKKMFFIWIISLILSLILLIWTFQHEPIGLDVKKDRNKGNMHHKVFIIDSETVITGSYNPTESGNKRNDENLIIIHDKKIAEKYLEEFGKVYYP